MAYKTKIFRGTCADVAREMNEWFSANEIVISHVLQTEQSINVLTVTIIYIGVDKQPIVRRAALGKRKEEKTKEMISNPATFYINDSKAKSFTYEGGSTLFNWSPYDSKLSTSMESNVIFFANDDAHARDVLRRLFEFWISCNEKYVAYKKKVDHAFTEHATAEINVLRRYVENIQSMVIRRAPVNQFYEVGWASNDTLSVYEK